MGIRFQGKTVCCNLGVHYHVVHGKRCAGRGWFEQHSASVDYNMDCTGLLHVGRNVSGVVCGSETSFLYVEKMSSFWATAALQTLENLV